MSTRPLSLRKESDMRTLIDERPLIVQPSLVRILGNLQRAVILQQIHWLLQNPDNGYHDEDGTKWIWGSYREWCQRYFTMWSERQLRRHIRWLEENGYLLSRKPNSDQWDHTKHYTINYILLQQAEDRLKDADPPYLEDRSDRNGGSMGQNGPIDVTETADRSDQSGSSMRTSVSASSIEAKNTTEITTETTTTTHHQGEDGSNRDERPEKSSSSGGSGFPEQDEEYGRLVRMAMDSGLYIGSIQAELLKDMLEEYGAVEVENAMRTAASAGKLNLRYVEGICKRRRQGDEPPPSKTPPEKAKRRPPKPKDLIEEWASYYDEASGQWITPQNVIR